MGNKIKLKKALRDNLKEKYFSLGLGRQKHKDKLDLKNHKIDKMPDVIYSKSTYEAYLRHTTMFVDYCYAHDVRTIEGARELAPTYLNELIDNGLSASTIHLKACSIAKAMDCSHNDFGVILPARVRADIVRSRGRAARDSGFSLEKNKEIIEFCQSTGLRRSELAKVSGSDVTKKGNNVIVHVKNGKGGKSRNVVVYANDDIKNQILDKAKDRGSQVLFPRIPSHMDVHSYRSEYATKVYNTHKRDIAKIPGEDKYICRKDKAGETYDKKAMLIASKQLGHNRISIIAQAYLR